MNEIAKLPSLQDVVDEYEKKIGDIQNTIDTFKASVSAIEALATVGGKYTGSIWEGHAPAIEERSIKKNLTKSAWTYVYEGLNINKIASATDRKKIEDAIENPPEFTLDNVRATFADFLKTPRFHILKGLAECFCSLDPFFKSHSNVRVGVKGLPKRIILNNAVSYNGYAYNKLYDLLRAVDAYFGRHQINFGQFCDLHKIAVDGPPKDSKEYKSIILVDGDAVAPDCGPDDIIIRITERNTPIYQGIELRCFDNGNMHLYFDTDTMLAINRGLAEFYGHVLPDTPEENAERPQSTEVSKNLQFYPTPKEAADRLISLAEIREGHLVLEPSCGDGALLSAILQAKSGAKVFGIEVDAGRAKEAMAFGYPVKCANFLETTPHESYDRVIMNPPFYGRHYLKHIKHALKYLKPGGCLFSILPATAWYDHGEISAMKKEFGAVWYDLPICSFKESGTNINTGIVKIVRR